MGDTTIPWAHESFNPWHGCVKVSPGCLNCYAEAFSKRVGRDIWGKNRPRLVMGDAYWGQLDKWMRKSYRFRQRLRVFCASMGDLFEDVGGPSAGDVLRARERLWRAIPESQPPTMAWGLDYLLLTKRPENIARMIPAEWFERNPPNVWLGFSAEDQHWLEVRAEHARYLRRMGWKGIIFVSAEPLLGKLELWDYLVDGTISWVIVGGESGHGARQCDPEWIRSIVGQCRNAGVPVFVKQDSGRFPDRWGRIPQNLRIREFPRAYGGGIPSVEAANHAL